MKKYFLFACVAAALVSCSSDEFLGENQGLSQAETGAILFQSTNMKATRATAGKAAADLLGGNFIVEGFKGTEGTNVASEDVVFDNYLVVWGQNTAGTTEDNTNDWAYVGKDNSDHMAADVLNGTAFGRGVKTQSIKYWDYSTDQYDFVAYSTGKLNMIATGDPETGKSVKVTKINDEWRTDTDEPAVAYSFTAANANDFAQCYFTDVTPVKKAANEYNKPVTLTFKNLSAKVRVGLYEIVPGYSVKDVRFYTDDATAIAENATISEKKATLFLPAGKTFAEAGTINVSYPLLGTANNAKDGYLKADVTVAPTAATGDPSTKGFGPLNYTGKEGAEADATVYLGRTLKDATMAGKAEDKYFTYVIPTSNTNALTLRVNYTLVSTDGSGEEINVHGAKAVVPANFAEWQPNYAYTYIFKISDNTNGWTSLDPDDPAGLFPITFDAVVADITDASEEQTTVTTVATPSITSYQKDHAQGAEYKAGDIYVEVMQNGALVADLNEANKTYLYTTTDNKATEADVIDALQMNVATTGVTGRNGLTLTAATSLLSTEVEKIPAVDGTEISVTKGQAAKIAAEASKNYVFVYDFTPATAPAATVIYSYDIAANTVGATEPTDWAGNYFTKTVDPATGEVTYTEATTFTAATATAPTYYYKKYVNNNRSYAVKVIKTGTAY